jgi:hypothetical protein
VATLGIAEAVERCRRRGSFAVEVGEPTGRKMEWQPRRLAAEAERVRERQSGHQDKRAPLGTLGRRASDGMG